MVFKVTQAVRVVTVLGIMWGAFASCAFAETTVAPNASGSAMAQGIMLAAFGIIFYFLFIRPQSKRAKEHRQLVDHLQKGDEVITSGGLLGKITGLTDQFLTISIAEGVEVSIQRHAIATSLPKGTLQSIK